MYATLGNHDFLCKVPELEDAGIRFLLNEHVVIEREGEALDFFTRFSIDAYAMGINILFYAMAH